MENKRKHRLVKSGENKILGSYVILPGWEATILGKVNDIISYFQLKQNQAKYTPIKTTESHSLVNTWPPLMSLIQFIGEKVVQLFYTP